MRQYKIIFIMADDKVFIDGDIHLSYKSAYNKMIRVNKNAKENNIHLCVSVIYSKFQNKNKSMSITRDQLIKSKMI